jgi:hypothetical protein
MNRLTLLAAPLLYCTGALASSLYFTANDSAGVGRVEIPIGDPQRPADIGASDFTFEFWLRTDTGNTRTGGSCDRSGYTWIDGNIVFDRDRLRAPGRDFGVALGGGRIMFGVENANGSYTLCSAVRVDDGEWHHVALQRRLSDGRLWMYVDGRLDAQATGPAGDISYPDGAASDDPREALLVIGREKFDFAGTAGYRGYIDELRLSNTLRYSGNSFAVPTEPFGDSAGTLALYHFDEGAGTALTDAIGNQSPGTIRFSNAAGPFWRSDTPFAPAPANPGRLQFAANTYSASEGGQPITIVVRRVGGAQGSASVSFAIPTGSAVLDVDYRIDLATLTWADGDAASKSVVLTVIDDTEVESSESVTLMLTGATGAALGDPASATITIADNDSASSPPPPEPPPSQPPPPAPTPPSSGGGGGGGAADPYWLGGMLFALLLRLRRFSMRRGVIDRFG